MSWFSKPQPQTDGPNTEPLTQEHAAPDHKPKPEKDGLTYSELERDKDGWPIAPVQNDRPPLWRK